MALKQVSLFGDELPEDNSPLDGTRVIQTILYHSEEENIEFKKLCKEGMKGLFPDNFQEKGNISDFLLLHLRKHYGTNPEVTP